jgi:hypothetical protein
VPDAERRRADFAAVVCEKSADKVWVEAKLSIIRSTTADCAPAGLVAARAQQQIAANKLRLGPRLMITRRLIMRLIMRPRN